MCYTFNKVILTRVANVMTLFTELLGNFFLASPDLIKAPHL